MLSSVSRTFPIFRTSLRNMSKTSSEFGKSFARRKYYGEPEPKGISFLTEAGLGKDNIKYWFLYFTRDFGWNFARYPGYITLVTFLVTMAPFWFYEIYMEKVRFNPELLKVAS